MAKDKGQRPVHNIVQVAIQYNNNNTVDYLAVRFKPPKEIRSSQNICLTKIAILYVDD